MSEWRDERNRRSLERLRRALPAAFPAAVLAHALSRPFVPPTPRRAIESYWRAHPLRADRLARALAARTGPPPGWTWALGGPKGSGLPATFRLPPAPYREAGHALGPGSCCVCGGPVFRLGWHRDLWGDEVPNRNAAWHAACVAAWRFWCDPTPHAPVLKRLQRRRCPETGGRLLRGAQIDHRVPLFRVWQDRADLVWPAHLRYWSPENLGVVNGPAHRAKSAREAGIRAGRAELSAPA